MKKPLLIILTTFALGFILGMLVTGAIQKSKMNKFSKFVRGDRYKIENIQELQITPSQLEIMMPLTDSFAKLRDEVRDKCRDEFREFDQEYKKVIIECLTDDQKVIYEKYMEELQSHGPKGQPQMRQRRDKEKDDH